ncbi:MAG: FkbM family methyltransferase [Lachnospiraceae bacterium]|nr:FkbM family methyltransferase [Lachnospiraceae bacterium]
MDERICFPYQDDAQNIPEFLNGITQVYGRMLDEKSQRIFAGRLLVSLTGDYSHMRSVLIHTPGGKRLNEVLCKDGSLKYIYGAGIRGKRLAELFPDNNWGGFIDISRNGEFYNNIKILDLNQFLSIYTQGMTIIVSNMQGTQDIKDNLLEKGVFPEDIYVLNDFDAESAKGMYFPTDCIQAVVEKEKSFVDIGCYDGKDSLDYMRWMDNDKAKIYAFEPDMTNYKVCREKLNAYPNIELFNVALSDMEQDVSVMGSGEMSYLGEGGNEKIRTQILDNVLQNRPVGYIKIDVEGHEVKVLKGAEKIIRNQHPVMAVSMYHKKSDIWRIPELLLEYNSEYAFYMRYYGAANGDTVLYAVDCKK